MLYQIYETQRSLMEPLTDFAQAASRLYTNPLSPLSHGPIAQRISAGYDLMYRLGKDYVKPIFGIQSVDVNGIEVAIHERIEMDKPFCELRRFKRFSDDSATLMSLKGQPVVLIVAPLSGHYATLLRDTVASMLKDHKVYITDWKNARNVPESEGSFHLDDYVNYVQDFIRHLQKGYGNCHVISVCQPTVPVLAAVSLMASRGETTPLSMTMMGGPIDATKCPTSVNNLATNRSLDWFENNVIYRVPPKFPGAGRRVYPGFLQYAGFVAMNPDRHASSHYDYFKNMIVGDDASTEAHRKFYDEYNAVLDMDADYYLETIATVFQEFRLIKGTWDIKSPSGKAERVRPQDITTTGLLTVEGELDDISGSGQTKAAHDLCINVPKKHSKHFEAKGAGHYGIFSGKRWREMVYPQVREFIRAHHVSVTATTPAPVVNSPPKAANQAQPSKKRVAVQSTTVPATVVATAATPAPINQVSTTVTATVAPAPTTLLAQPIETLLAPDLAPERPTATAAVTTVVEAKAVEIAKETAQPLAAQEPSKTTLSETAVLPIATRWVGEASLADATPTPSNQQSNKGSVQKVAAALKTAASTSASKAPKA